MDAHIQDLFARGAFPENLNDEDLPDIPQEGLQAANELSDAVEDEGLDAEVSDADSEILELEANIKKGDAELAAFIAAQKKLRVNNDSEPESDSSLPPVSNRGRRKRGRGGARGPRKAAEPSGEIKFRLGQASMAFMEERYDDAMEIIFEVIRLNAETHQAWVLLSSIFQELGKNEEALMSMVFAAHMRPKDVGGWMAAAQFALDDTQGSREKNLYTAGLCYSAAIRANPKYLKARLAKANVSLEQGSSTLAFTEYQRVLKLRPYDISVIRHMAEASFEAKDAPRAVQATIEAYQKCITEARMGEPLQNGEFDWSDLIIYVEAFAFLGSYGDAILALRSVARWLVGRQDEPFWDDYELDDREWDREDDRRREVAEFDPHRYPAGTYGFSLPLDLRAKLAVYRLKLGHVDEAMRHLTWLLPEDPATLEFFADTPFVIKDVATGLFESRHIPMSLSYCDLCSKVLFEPDPEVLVTQGKCYLELGDESAAEDCFLSAIELDDHNVAARYQLAQLYERAQEKDEAFILINEAMELERQAEEGAEDDAQTEGGQRAARPRKPRAPRPKRPRVPRPPSARKPRTRVRRLGTAAKRREYEEAVTANFKEKYSLVRELRSRVASGDKNAMQQWMAAAKDLVDDFRSFREFYPWDKYLQFLGYGSFFQENARQPHAKSDMAAMAERLQQNLAPEDSEGQLPLRRHEHRGIPFDEWLDLFLEYAISLAHTQQAHEAYRVCQSARDSIVYKSNDNMFLIHVAWAACAVYVGDEETCVAMARFFLKNMHGSTDTYRMFSALCRVCQSPVSWYASGPTQKFIMRQIKAMDRCLLHRGQGDTVAQGDKDGPKYDALDVCLLMLYGHILFSSTSYTYAIGYFLRAVSIDPDNPMVNLSLGLGYVHYSLKRQSENRQFLITQGFVYLFRYYENRVKSADVAERQEAHYNLARTYHLIGIYHLAAEYYGRVLREGEAIRQQGLGVNGVDSGSDRRQEEFVVEAATNLRTFSLINGDLKTAKLLTDTWLVLR
ncbi:Transcription factor tau subunit sfc4 [Pleurostoma richardsiae]|uniref:Transcription factor tau subunit sfc4 n=1 Tax=Pleurostoma richardsiae TaxID=41990 RepID=A0AA38VVD5_9PEZI|nr:Transcription factor tau subunit sfc4 [Pleurostoma richardsiae]